MPSVRMGWPLPCFTFIQAMKREPMAMATSWPVNRAMAERKVR